MTLAAWINNLENQLCKFSILERHKVINKVERDLITFKQSGNSDDEIVLKLGTVEEVITQALTIHTTILKSKFEISSIVPMQPKKAIHGGVNVIKNTKSWVVAPLSLFFKLTMLFLTFWLPILALPVFLGLIGIEWILINNALDYIMGLTIVVSIALLSSIASIFFAEIFDRANDVVVKKYDNKLCHKIKSLDVGERFNRRKHIYTNYFIIGMICSVVALILSIISQTV